MGIHLKGAGEALKIMFGITAVACIALVVFIVAMLPHFDSARLFDIPVSSHAVQVAFAVWLYGNMGRSALCHLVFLAVEGVPLAAEEARSSTFFTTWLDRFNVDIGIVCTFIFLGGAAGSNALKIQGHL